MKRLSSLRPDLDALLKEDPRAAKKAPVEPGAAAPAKPAPPDRATSFADRIAARHDTSSPTPRVRESKVAENVPEPDVLLLKAKRGGR